MAEVFKGAANLLEEAMQVVAVDLGHQVVLSSARVLQHVALRVSEPEANPIQPRGRQFFKGESGDVVSRELPPHKLVAFLVTLKCIDALSRLRAPCTAQLELTRPELFTKVLQRVLAGLFVASVEKFERVPCSSSEG